MWEVSETEIEQIDRVTEWGLWEEAELHQL